MRRGNVRELLIGADLDWRWRGTDRGIDWISDRYVLARADVFKGEPKTSLVLPTTAIRKVLDKARAAPLYPGRVYESQQCVGVDGRPLILVGVGPICVAVEPTAWRAWCLTDLTPRLNSDGLVLWYGPVRGKPVLFGVLAVVRLGTS